MLAGAGVYSLQIVLMERYAPRFDALAFTFVEMAAAFLGLLVVALALGDLGVPRGWTVWGALLVTGVFASALGYLVQTWAQRRTSATRTALAFTMEPVWAAFFGYTLAGDRLGALGWGGCVAIMAGILLAEPAAAAALAAPGSPLAVVDRVQENDSEPDHDHRGDPTVRGRDRGNRNRGGERGERKDERPLPAPSRCRDPSHGALVESLLDAIDEGVDHMGLHFPAELAASLDRSLDLVPFHHPASLGRWSRQNLI